MEIESVGLEESAGGGSRSSTVACTVPRVSNHERSILTILKLSGRTPRYLCAHGEVVELVFEAASTPLVWAAIATFFTELLPCYGASTISP